MSILPLLECVECRTGYSEWDVKRGNFFITTMVCLRCYERMQKSPYEESCFGKRTVMKGGRKFYGYNPQARECSQECPDRHICRVMVRKLPPAK